jgi:hypothetical protein
LNSMRFMCFSGAWCAAAGEAKRSRPSRARGLAGGGRGRRRPRGQRELPGYEVDAKFWHRDGPRGA